MKTLLILLAVFSVSNLYGLDNLEKSALRNEIKSRIENIVQTDDPNSRVDVSLSFFRPKKKQKASINYENPFILSRKPNVIEEKAELKLNRVSLTIFSKYSKEEFPKGLSKKVNSIVREYTKRSKVSFERVFKAELGYWDKMKSLGPFESTLIGLFMAGLFLFVSFRLISFYFASKKSEQTDFRGIISDSVDSLKESIENLSFAQATHHNGGDFASVTKPFNFEISAGGENFLKDFSEDAIHELLMDCYWCEEDEYAAFIWSKLDLVRKGNLLTKDQRIGDYANYISNIEGVDKKYINETYYFNPYNLSSIPNANLSDLVLKYNSIFHLLPKIRISCLGIDANQKKKLMMRKFSRKDTEMELQNIRWDEYMSTERREFEKNHTFSFESHEEESEFFEDPNLDFSLVSSFPSLSWLTFLRSKDIGEILEPFSAKELAMAWDAPEATLAKLEVTLPEKKVELLHSYQEQVKTNRKSEVFQEIIRRANAKLKERSLRSVA